MTTNTHTQYTDHNASEGAVSTDAIGRTGAGSDGHNNRGIN